MQLNQLAFTPQFCYQGMVAVVDAVLCSVCALQLTMLRAQLWNACVIQGLAVSLRQFGVLWAQERRLQRMLQFGGVQAALMCCTDEAALAASTLIEL